jgi:hypothetical protein
MSELLILLTTLALALSPATRPAGDRAAGRPVRSSVEPARRPTTLPESPRATAGVMAPLRPPVPPRPPAPRPPADLTPSRFNPAQTQALLEQLASPRFSVREQATQTLCQLREADLPLLIRAYDEEKRYEPKRRIRYVIEYVFHRDQIVGRDGFMGVEVVSQVLADLSDPISGRITRGVVVRKVKPGFAAERAGLKDGDIIIALDGEPVPDDPTTNSFVHRVGSHLPGTMLSLRVLRAGQTRTARLTLGQDQTKLLLGARLTPVAAEVGAQGMLVAGVEEDSPAARAGLRRNDLIRSFEGMPLGSYANQIENVLRTLKAGDSVRLEISRLQVMALDIRLGSRPPEFIQDVKDLAEARSRFMRWWQDQGGDLPARLPDPVQRAFIVGIPPQRLTPETTLLP